MSRKFQGFFLFLILLILPNVSASSFTGIFNDYGNDTGSDGLFNFLTIGAEVNIDASKDYMIYGRLEDSQGNFFEYNNCRSLPLGKYIFILDFDGLKLYRNKVNGPYNLKYISLSSLTSCGGGGMPPETEESLIDAYSTAAYQYTQFQKGEAAVYCDTSPCIASSELIKSRDSINIAEPNAPNTIDGCEDGGYGSYLNSESIENITVTSLNNSFFQVGDTVRADIWAYCDSSFDKLNFVYANGVDDIQFVVKDNADCGSVGLKQFSTTFELDNNIGQHAVRGVFSFNLNPNTVCGEDDSQKDWADTDDVVLNVQGCSVDDDCATTECDHLDSSTFGCYFGTYRDYHDSANSCTQGFTCTQNECTVYDEIITDNDGDGYGMECDNDCADINGDCDIYAGDAYTYCINNLDAINPGVSEVCDNEVDDDCDSYIDNADPECLGNYELTLIKGWNLISLPKIEDNDINEIIKLFGDNLEKIVALKNGTQYIYDKLDAVNSNLDELFEADGFWIKLNDSLALMVKNESAMYGNLYLKKGWNLIGYPSLEERDVNELFLDVMHNIEFIYVYNDQFNSFNPKKQTNFPIKPGRGILVKVKNDVSWHFDGVYHAGEESFELDLVDGWNLISIPLISNKTRAEIFGSNKLYYLNNNGWGELGELNYSYGYWVKSNEGIIVINGNRIVSLNFEISEGWNLINYPLREEKNVELFFQNVIDNIELVEIFYDGEWKNFNPSKNSGLNSLIALKPGKGIFVKVKGNANWHFDGNELVAT